MNTFWPGLTCARSLSVCQVVNPTIGTEAACTKSRLAGLSAAWLSGAWRRSLAVLPQAQAWLAAQPMTARTLLRRAAAVPAGVLAAAVAAVAVLLAALATPALGAIAAAGLAMFGALQFAAVAAERRRPARAPLLFALHAVLLIGVAQALPIAALPLWCAQMALLLRSALR